MSSANIKLMFVLLCAACTSTAFAAKKKPSQQIATVEQRKKICDQLIVPTQNALAPIQPLLEQFREIVVLQDPIAQYQHSFQLDGGQVDRIHHELDDNGEHITIKVHVNSPDAHAYAGLIGYDPKMSEARSLMLNGQPVTAVTGSQNSLPLAAPTISDEQLLDNVIDKEDVYSASKGSRLLPADVKENIKKHLRDNKQFLAELRSQVPAIRSNPFLTLSNEGMSRYFWFKPDRHPRLAPARVLDIHRQLSPEGYIILVEWIGEDPIDGKRIRHVRTLSYLEVKSIVSNENQNRDSAVSAFTQSLSSAEIQTLELAKSNKLQSFGYVDSNRQPLDRDESYVVIRAKDNSLDPINIMNSIVQTAIHSFILERWGNIDDLLNEEEKQSKRLNIIDVFTRQTAEFVLNRFKPKVALDVFAWVIIEDGTLLICPHLHHENNLKAQLLRMAHGRRIYAGGIFTYNKKGNLDVVLESNAYQTFNREDVNKLGFSYKTVTNGSIDLFVAAAFALQTRKIVSKITDSVPEIVTRFAAHKIEPRDSRRASQETYDYLKSFIRNYKYETSEPLIWDKGNPDDLPLSLDEWVKVTGYSQTDRDARGNLEYQKEHSYYVLKSNRNTPPSEIKKRYRKLMSRFGESMDRQSIQHIGRSLVSSAYTVLDMRSINLGKPEQ